MPSSKEKWIVLDPMDDGEGFHEFDTEAEAKACAEGILESAGDAASDYGWDENITGVAWGRFDLREQVVFTGKTAAPEDSDWDEFWHYELRPPATPTEGSE